MFSGQLACPRRGLLLSSILASLAWSAACTASPPAREVNRVTRASDSVIAAEVHRFADSVVRMVPIAGLSIVVKRGNTTFLRRGYGLADVDTDRPMTENTASRIGSVTKVFTAISIQKLAEKGQVDLDAPVAAYLSGLTLPPITVRQALNHTSGLPDYERGAIRQWLTERKPITKDFVLRVLANDPARPPGQHWVYNNAGYYLLGLVIEKVSGVSYEEFIEREIVRPLGLTATWMIPRRPASAIETMNYYLVNGKFVRDSVWDLPGIWAGGGMFSSAVDLAELLHALASEKIVSDSAVAQMLAPTILPSGARADYGLGVRLGAIAGHPKWGHTGSARSTRAAAAYYPRDSLAVVVLMNTEQEDIPIGAIEIEGRVARTVLGITTTRRSGLRPDTATARAYGGIYTDGSVQSRITNRDGVLHLSRVGSSSPEVPLLYQGGDVWADPEYAEYLFIFQKRGDTPTALARYDNGWFVGVRSRAGAEH